MEIGIPLPAGFKESTEKCLCGNPRWLLPSGEIQETCPECQIKEIDRLASEEIIARERSAIIPEGYRHCTWHEGDETSGLGIALRKVKAWADSFQPPACLMLCGGQGVGKTASAYLTEWELWKKGHSVYHVSQVDLYQAYLGKGGEDEVGNGSRHTLHLAQTADVLTIDEVGYIQPSDAARQFFRSLHVSRHDKKNGSLILITNFKIETVAQFFDRSRLEDKRWTEIIFSGCQTLRSK